RISDYNFETNFFAWEGLGTGWGRVNHTGEGIESQSSGNYSARCTDAMGGQELVQDLTDPSVESLYFNNLVFWTYLEGSFETSVIVTFRYEGGDSTEYVFEVNQVDTWQRHREPVEVKNPIEVVFQKHTDGSGILIDDIELRGGEYFNNFHLMGTNRQAEDVFSKVVYGTRVSLIVSMGAILISLTIGLPLGMVAGYFRGKIDELIMRITDIFLTLPFYFVMILVIVLLQQTQWLDNLIIQLHLTAEIVLVSVTLGLGLFGWMGVTRLIRATILQVREMDYVEAARALGASNRRIMLIHILPNILAPLIVAITFNLAVNIVAEAGLAFLGYTNDSLSSWGRELTNGFGIVTEAWWPVMFPALLIVSAVMAFNLLGDGLRDAFDPRLR
ncbi:MAG: ABC transporter permease subunit, partial [Candidatus Hodarchaeales archaeon]